MDKKLAGLLGAIGAAATLNVAQAAIANDPSTALTAQSYADLLNPIPNATAKLKAADEADGTARVRVAENALGNASRRNRVYPHQTWMTPTSPKLLPTLR